VWVNTIQAPARLYSTEAAASPLAISNRPVAGLADARAWAGHSARDGGAAVGTGDGEVGSSA
jgi:hypothetical protein